MSASFPNSIKTFTPKTDNVDDVMADDINSLQNEIVALESREKAIKTVSANYIILNTDKKILVDTTSGDIDITLPTAVGTNGLDFLVKKVAGSNLVNVNTTSGQTIDGVSMKIIKNINSALGVSSDGTNYIID